MNLDLQGLFDALLEGVLVLDADDRIELVNPEARRLLGAAHDVVAGKTLGEALGADHPVCSVVARVRASGRASIHDELEIPQRFESPIPVDVAVSNIGEAPRGKPAAIAIAMRDRSAARTLREEISERERQESYGHIAAGIAHEVRNPLGGIRGAAELIGMNSKDDRSRKAASLIVGEVDRISGLVDELMVFARGDRLEPKSVNIHRLLDTLLDLARLERGHESIEIVRRYDPSLPELEADESRLQQVFLNLVRNAMQAMEARGGRLTVSTGMTLEHRLVGLDGRARPTVRIRFQDRGPGIPEAILGRLSTPFFTTKPKGTGLGLSVARHWVRRHGGRLRIDSVVGEGTRVDVDLPLTPPAQTAQAHHEPIEEFRE
ncbi:PAS domain-containing protein [Myxococcota bacterium]|nr:PAS domain-containing protein [Myxococcota bacterium]